MKKIFWILLFCSVGLLYIRPLRVVSEDVSLRYTIYFDSACENEAEIKNAILAVYEGIIQGVDRSSRTTLVLQSLEEFALTEEFRVESVLGGIVITIGDGKGTLISGDFEWIRCANTVHTRSWLQETLGF